LQNQGLKIITPSEAQLQQWYKLAAHSREQAIANNQVSQQAVDQATTYLKELQQSQTAAP
jgi:hypothetical protein